MDGYGMKRHWDPSPDPENRGLIVRLMDEGGGGDTRDEMFNLTIAFVENQDGSVSMFFIPVSDQNPQEGLGLTICFIEWSNN